jgi:hypothetical protein
MANEVEMSKGRIWTGRVIMVLVVAFLIFDGVTKVMQVAPVRQAFAEMGYAEFLAPRIGGLLLACVALYLIPRTSIFGAILLTAYLGGAVDCQVRALKPAFNITFPIIFGVLLWLSLYLRNPRLGTLLQQWLGDTN